MMVVVGIGFCFVGAALIALGALMQWLHGQLTILLQQIPGELQSMASPQLARVISLLRLLPALRWVGAGAGAVMIILGWLAYPSAWFFALIAFVGIGIFSIRGHIERWFSAMLQQQISRALRQQL